MYRNRTPARVSSALPAACASRKPAPAMGSISRVGQARGYAQREANPEARPKESMRKGPPHWKAKLGSESEKIIKAEQLPDMSVDELRRMSLSPKEAKNMTINNVNEVRDEAKTK